LQCNATTTTVTMMKGADDHDKEDPSKRVLPDGQGDGSNSNAIAKNNVHWRRGDQ
jgi:hypothetical protein